MAGRLHPLATFAFAVRQLGVAPEVAVEAVRAAFESLAEREAT